MELDYSYIQVKLREDMVKDVYADLFKAGLRINDKYELHCTMMYDERDIESPLSILDPHREFRAKIIGMGVLGDANVFHLTSDELLEKFRELKEDGYEHSYGTPLFHMSLGYKLDDYEVLIMDQVFSEWMGRELVFNNLSFGFKKEPK